MPAFISHSLMYKGFTKKFNIPCKPAFYWGLQGPDLLFYCRISKKLPYRTKTVKYGSALHNIPIRKTYAAISKYLKGLDGYKKRVITSYVAGFIAHNSLDYYAHPYIFYKENEYMRDYGYTKHEHAHNKIESDIDSLLWQGFTGRNIKKFKIKNENMPSMKVKEYIAELYVYLINVLCGNNITAQDIIPCFTEARFLMKILTNESTLVNVLSHVAENKLGIKDKGEISAFVRIKTPDFRIMNLEKHNWHNINNPNAIKNDSVVQLFENAYVATNHEIKRFFASLENKLDYIPEKFGSFENGRLDI